jgi:cyclopropane fatty-acyl-phospholipid synthase-like methyltransferase
MRWDKKDIIEYYRRNEFGYSLWGRNMHFGYWTKETKTLRQATQKFNQILAETAQISSDDNVLDTGCGVGGSAIFLAKTIGCKVTGITICPRQVDLAYTNAKKEGVEHLVEFNEMDFCNTSFDNSTFSVVWGLESICYAESKKKYINEVFRVLNEKGRLIVADGMASRDKYEGKDAWLMERWLDGWIVNNVETPDAFQRYAYEAGFSTVKYRNVSKEVIRTSRLLFYISFLSIFFHLLDRVVRIRQYPFDALFNQYLAMKKDLWEYGIIFAEK